MCFSLGWFEDVLVWLVILAVIYGILQVLLPFVLGPLGAAGSVIITVLRLILWGFVAIFIIHICFSLIGCMGGSLHLPRMGG
jgi:hypothetical protein